MSAATDEAALLIHIDYAGSKIAASIDQDTTFRDLAEDFAAHIGASVSKVALWPKPKPGYLKYPFSDERVLGFVSDKFSIKGIGTPSQEVQERDKKGQAIVARLNQRNRNRESAPRQKSTPKKDWAQIQDEAQYTFHTIRPLPYLPNPEKSQRFLERLANDPGIKHSMRKHKFSVALLTEMNPIEHTTHESRTLGLNRNRGEVIELRLRTDAYDGYRDYKVIRKTLCHELSHNVWSDHDRNFWDLTKQIEDEVQRNDTLHGGHKLSDSEFYNPEDQYEDLQIDGGGWQGGEFVVGGQGDTQGLSRRDLLARAAEARSRQARELVEKKASSSPDSQAHPD